MRIIVGIVLLLVFSSSTCERKKSTDEQIELEKINKYSSKFAGQLIPNRFDLAEDTEISTEILGNGNKFSIDEKGTIKSKIRINFGTNDFVEGLFNIDAHGYCKFSETKKKTKRKDALASLGASIVLGFRVETNVICTINGDWKPIDWAKILAPEPQREVYSPLPSIKRLNALILTREELFDELNYDEARVIKDYYLDEDRSLAGLKEAGDRVINLDTQIIKIYSKILANFSPEEMGGLGLYQDYKKAGFWNVHEEEAYHKFMKEKFDKNAQMKLHSNYEVLACELLLQISPKLYWNKRPLTKDDF